VQSSLLSLRSIVAALPLLLKLLLVRAKGVLSSDVELIERSYV
jgi:hypothetical protein